MEWREAYESERRRVQRRDDEIQCLKDDVAKYKAQELKFTASYQRVVDERDWYWTEWEKAKTDLRKTQEQLEQLQDQVRSGLPPKLTTKARKAHRGNKKKTPVSAE